MPDNQPDGHQVCPGAAGIDDLIFGRPGQQREARRKPGETLRLELTVAIPQSLLELLRHSLQKCHRLRQTELGRIISQLHQLLVDLADGLQHPAGLRHLGHRALRRLDPLIDAPPVDTRKTGSHRKHMPCCQEETEDDLWFSILGKVVEVHWRERRRGSFRKRGFGKMREKLVAQKLVALGMLQMVSQILRLAAPFIFAHGVNSRAWAYMGIAIISIFSAYRSNGFSQRCEWGAWVISLAVQASGLVFSINQGYPLPFVFYLAGMLPIAIIPERTLYLPFVELISHTIGLSAIFYSILIA